MKKAEFRTPLIQSAAVLGGVLVLFGIVASSGGGHSDGGSLGVLFGIGQLILFGIAMVLALGISIAILIGLFLAAVAMVNPGQASQMYADLKKNSSLNAIIKNSSCCAQETAENCLSQEEYDRMKEDIALLQKKNLLLQENINSVSGDNSLLQTNIDNLSEENSTLKEQFGELSGAVEQLQNSEKEIKELVERLTVSVEAGADKELKEQIVKLEKLHAATQAEVESLLERLNSLETSGKELLTTGIFAYITNQEDQDLFIMCVEEALKQEMTYAQIDEYLTKNLPAELDKEIKDHPSLTKNYIRDQRRD